MLTVPGRMGPATRESRWKKQHRRVRPAVPPFAEGTPPLRRTRGAGAFARRPGVWHLDAAWPPGRM